MVCPSFKDKSSFSTGASLSFCICSSKRRDLKWSWRATFRSNASVRSAKPNPTWPKVSVLMTKYLKAKQYNKCLHTFKKSKNPVSLLGLRSLLVSVLPDAEIWSGLEGHPKVILDHKMSFVISFLCPFLSILITKGMVISRYSLFLKFCMHLNFEFLRQNSKLKCMQKFWTIKCTLRLAAPLYNTVCIKQAVKEKYAMYWSWHS